MGGKGKPTKTSKAHQKPTKSSFFHDTNFADKSKLMGFDMPSGSFGGDESSKTHYGIDSNLEIIFKKMTKKDPTTKLKALKEFIAYCAQLEITDRIVEIYAKLYTVISMDVDNLVRESSQTALLTLITANKIESNGDIMKKLFPSLLISMFDTHPVTASIAQNCFHKAFNSDVGDILATCQEDVLETFTKNITVLTAQTICNTQSYTPEECQAKYERVVIGSLKAYGMYIEKINKEKLQEFKEKNLQLISHDKFTSLSKSKTPIIRSAYFETVSNLLQFAPELLINVKEKLVAIIFKSIDESDPAISSHIWSCVLLGQIKIELWWTFINMKLFFEKLFIILRSCTNCSLIFPNLLPLVSNFKGVFIGNQMENFYSNLMKNLHHGLSNDQTDKLLRSEFSSITTAYFEVLQFILIQIVNQVEISDDDKIKLCFRYMDEYIIATTFWCLNKKGSFPKKLIYQGIAKIIHFAGNNTLNVMYASLYERFWSETYKIIASSMETNQDLKETSSSQIELIKNLSPPTKKQVRMEIDKVCEKEDAPMMSKNLELLVQKVCQIYIEKINVTMDEHLVKSLESLVKSYQSKELFEYLKNENQCEVFEIFQKWLKDEDIRHESVIEIITILYTNLENDSSKINILNYWEEMTVKQKSLFICKSLDYPLNEDKLIVNFNRKTISMHIVEMAKSTQGDSIKILKKCFHKNRDSFPISDETCHKVINEVRTNLTKLNVSFLTEIFPTISMSADKRDLRDKLFLTLFEYALNKSHEENLIWQIISTLNEGLSNGTLKIDKNLMQICTEIAKDKLVNLQELTESRLEFVALVITILQSNFFENGKNEENSYYLTVTSLNNLSYLNSLVSHIELLQGKIYSQNAIKSEEHEEIDFQKILNETIENNVFIVNVVLMMSVGDLKSLKKPHKEESDEAKFDEDYEDNESEPVTEVEESSTKLFEKLIDRCSLDFGDHRCLVFDTFGIILKSFYVLNVLLKNYTSLNAKQKTWIKYLEERLKAIISTMPDEIILDIKEKLPNLLLSSKKYSGNIELLLSETIGEQSELSIDQLKTFELFAEHQKKILPLKLLENLSSDMGMNVTLMSLLIENHLEVNNFNETSDKRIIEFSLNLLDEIILQNKSSAFLLYKRDIKTEKVDDVLLTTSIMNFLSQTIITFPSKLNESQWDFIRLALSNWTLTLKKSYEKVTDVKIQAFIISIYKLNAALLKFITNERVKSSSKLIASVIDEWQSIFSTDVNTILLQIFMEIVKNIESFERQRIFMDILCHHIDIDFGGILKLRSSLISIDDCLKFAADNLKNERNISVCVVALKFVKQLVPEILKSDQEALLQNNSKYSDDAVVPSDWHKLEVFKETLVKCQEIIQKHVDISSLRFSEASDVTKIPSDIALTYLLSWNCILSICTDSPLELRSVYINWISVNNFHEVFLSSLFDMMPRAVIKSADICLQLGFSSFSPVEPNYENVSIERFASFTYSLALRVMPVLVRKWWHGNDSKIAHLIEKITTNYVSPTLCTEELTALINKREKYGNMNIRVLMNSREVIATYIIESAKMELQLKLANNHPLGVIKVESKKHLGGKLQGWEIVKQLSIYLSHQNGRLCDGINIWKRNLDKKYEGVEECFICYSVVQLDNLQLPKITCKACKKKFHSTCLYRWFSSSNKSTCPLCRSDF